MDDTMPPPPAPEPPQLETPPSLPWERPGGLKGLLRTIGLFVTRPDDAFSSMAPVGLGRAFVYALLMSWLELIVGVAYWTMFQSPFFLMNIPEVRDELAELAVGAGVMALIATGIFILTPVLLAIGLFIHTAILHLMLLIIGEGRRGFETTARVICYSHTADVANLIPFCGGLLAFVWFIALQIIGIARAHQCSYGKAALAVFLPVLLCCTCLTVALAFWGTLLLGALGEH